VKREAHRPACVLSARSAAPRRAHLASRIRNPQPRRSSLSQAATRWNIHRGVMLASGGLSVLETQSILNRCIFLVAVLLDHARDAQSRGFCDRNAPVTDGTYRTRDIHGLAPSPSSAPTSPLIVCGAPEPHSDLSQNEDEARASSSSGETRSDPGTARRIAPKSARILIPWNRRPTELRRVSAWIY
jgi:hypothetical protein